MHKSEDGKLAVIAFLFLVGEESEFLAQVIVTMKSNQIVGILFNLERSV